MQQARILGDSGIGYRESLDQVGQARTAEAVELRKACKDWHLPGKRQRSSTTDMNGIMVLPSASTMVESRSRTELEKRKEHGYGVRGHFCCTLQS